MAPTGWRLPADSFLVPPWLQALPSQLARRNGDRAGYATELEPKTIQQAKTPILMAMLPSVIPAGVVAEVAANNIRNS